MKVNNLQVMPSRKMFGDTDQNNILQMRRSIKKINLQYLSVGKNTFSYVLVHHSDSTHGVRS